MKFLSGRSGPLPCLVRHNRALPVLLPLSVYSLQPRRSAVRKMVNLLEEKDVFFLHTCCNRYAQEDSQSHPAKCLEPGAF